MGQVFPHAPQLALSVWKLAQYASAPVPHIMRPPPHVAAHAPFEQTVPASQVVPHATLLALSVWKLVQNASAPVPH